MSFLLITISIGLLVNEKEDPGNDIEGELQSVSSDISPITGFIENRGQYPNDVHFACNLERGHLLFRETSVNLITFKVNSSPDEIEFSYPGSNNVKPAGEEELSYRVNFFMDDHSENWVSGARSYGKVVYNDLWNGIDLVYLMEEGSLKYELHLSPFSDIDDVNIMVKGVNGLDIVEEDLVLSTSTGVNILDEDLRVRYADGDMELIGGRFILIEENCYGFELDDPDTTRPVIVDPYVRSTYFGPTSEEWMTDIEVSGDGYIIVSGKTYSSGGYSGNTYGSGPTGDNTSLMIAKMDPLLKEIQFITFIGDAPNIAPMDMVLDDEGNIYLTGICFYPDFPTTPGAYDRNFNGDDDVYLLKISPDGSNLIFSTLMGGGGNDDPYGITFGADGSIYILGDTRSTDFPLTAGAYDIDVAIYSEKAFITRFDKTGSKILSSTVFGNQSEIMVYDGDIETDVDGNILITGGTTWESFPITQGTPSRPADQKDMFLTRFSNDLTRILSSCRIGGNYSDSGHEIDIDDDGGIIVAGISEFIDFPHDHEILDTYYDGYNDFKDYFVVKFDHDISRIEFSTLVGGNSSDSIGSMLVDEMGNIHLVGYTASKGFPHVNWSMDGTYGTNGLNGEGDGMYFMLHRNGTHLVDSFYLGGTEYDRIDDLALNEQDDLYFLGYTRSDDFPITPGTYRTGFFSYGSNYISLYSNRTLIPGPRMLELDLGANGAELTWTAPDLIGNQSLNGYLIYRGNDLSSMILIDEVINGTYYLDEEIEMGVVTYYYVKANLSIGISGSSNLVIANDIYPPNISPLPDLSPLVPFTFLEIATEVTDNLGVKDVRVTYCFDGMEETAVDLNWSGNDTYQCSIPIHLADNITLTISAVDIWGNTASLGPYEYDIRKGGEYWWGSIGRDEDGSSGALFNVEVSLNYPQYHESAEVEYWFGTGEKEQFEMNRVDGGFIAHIQIPIDRFGEFNYLVRLTSGDGSVNETTVYHCWIHDTTLPWIEQVQNVELNTGQNISIELYFGDNIGVSNITISSDYLTLKDRNLTGNIEVPGEYNITITIEDLHGNIQSTCFMIIVQENEDPNDIATSEGKEKTNLVWGLVIGVLVFIVIVSMILYVNSKRKAVLSEE